MVFRPARAARVTSRRYGGFQSRGKRLPFADIDIGGRETHAGSTVLTGVGKEAANDAKTKLEGAGAVVVLA